MAKIEVDFDALKRAVAEGAQKDLGWVTLISSSPLQSEPSQPFLPGSTPSVMSLPELVPSDTYRFLYRETRFLKLYYLLERLPHWEFGEILVYNSVDLGSLEEHPPVSETDMGGGVEQPPLPTEGLPTLYTQLTPLFGDWMPEAGLPPPYERLLGVTLGVGADPTSTKDPSFGLTFQITSLSPSTYPRLRATIGTSFGVNQ